MAYENIQVTYPNFCEGPQAGTFCTIDQAAVTTTMRVKNDTGALISEYSLSSSIINDVVGFEYVGPRGLTAFLDELTFFTFERVSASSVMIKRWETRVNNLTLNLKQQIVKNTTGNYSYDVDSACVEYYEREFDVANPGGINYIEMDDLSNVTPGTKLFLGPSSDADNIGATEQATVSYVSAGKVYLLSNLTYQYIIGDSIAFYNYAYVFSKIGYAGDASKGSLFQLNANNGNIDNVVFDGIYQNVSASKWAPYMGAVGAVMSNNLIYVDPYNYYINTRSQNLNNLENDKKTSIPVKDLVFYDSTFYKLMSKINLRNDDGTETTEDWSSYNYQQDTILPYTNCTQMYTNSAVLIGEGASTDFTVKVTDQFGVGLLGVAVTVSIDSGDPNGELDPLDGQIITDSNGEAAIGYESGTTYTGPTLLKAKAAGGSPSTGSSWVWEHTRVFSELERLNEGRVFQIYPSGEFEIFSNIIRQINNEWSLDYSIFSRTYFTAACGGDWINPSPHTGQVSSYLPHLPVGVQDGPILPFNGWSAPEHSNYGNLTLSQVEEFDSDVNVRQAAEFESYNDRLRQILDAEHYLQISQLRMVHHTNWVDGIAYTDLFTNVSINQFVFVEDAIPKFWSEKNPRGTDIWIRLRPFAFDLNPATLNFYVREVSSAGDTGWMDMFSYLTIFTFDAGGGLDGLDVTCDPPVDFHHDAIVYVRIEVQDTAATPNDVWVDYWFTVIPDYKFPYLDNLNPIREAITPVDSNIYFEIKDEGVGVDIDTFEMLVNSQLVSPSIVKISNFHYNVTYTPIKPFSYGKTVVVNVKVADASNQVNYLNDSYRLYTPQSSDVWFTEEYPQRCTRGLSPYSSVRFVVLGTGDGVDRDTIRVQILERDKTDEVNIVPIIYRIS